MRRRVEREYPIESPRGRDGGEIGEHTAQAQSQAQENSQIEHGSIDHEPDDADDGKGQKLAYFPHIALELVMGVRHRGWPRPNVMVGGTGIEPVTPAV